MKYYLIKPVIIQVFKKGLSEVGRKTECPQWVFDLQKKWSKGGIVHPTPGNKEYLVASPEELTHKDVIKELTEKEVKDLLAEIYPPIEKEQKVEGSDAKETVIIPTPDISAFAEKKLRY